LNSGVNARRFLRASRFAIEHSWRIFAPLGVSTEAGEDQREEAAVMLWLFSTSPSELRAALPSWIEALAAPARKTFLNPWTQEPRL
jgi:hypothetical protein